MNHTDINEQAVPTVEENTQIPTAPTAKKKEKRFKEGRRIKTLPPLTVITPFIMKKRNDALNYYTDSIEIDDAERFIAEKRAQGLTGFGLMHIFLAAYVRTVAEKPGINRFIRGQRIYARNNIEICLTIKKEMNPNSPDVVVKFFPKADATATDIYNEVNSVIEQSRETNDSDFEGLMNVLVKLPAFLFRFTIGTFTLLDYYRMLPRFLTKLSPFHGSYFITSMGSLGIRPIYHHIYNFGNVPLFTSLGTKYKENYIKSDGTVGTRRKVDFKVVMDERICDGFYYASALKTMMYYIRHPEKLDYPPEKVVPDVR